MLKVNNKSGEIYIYDVIGADWFGGGITAVNVIEALDSLKGKPATIRINSPGGIADEGIAIYNALKRWFRETFGLDNVSDKAVQQIVANARVNIVGTVAAHDGVSLLERLDDLARIHGLHVTGGLIAFLLVIGRAYAVKTFTHRDATSAIVVSYYWHFVDIVWIALFSAIYLVQ